MIDLKEILINSNYKKETEELINIANLAYKHWETYWTGFNSTYVCEEILKKRVTGLFYLKIKLELNYHGP